MEQQQLFDLLEKSKAGDRQAQEKLVAEAQNRVYYHCKKMLKNEDDALDATQDVLITMLTSLDKLREPAAFWGWVNGITANRCKHLLTQGTREWQIPEDEEGNSLLDSMETLDDQVVPDKAIDNAETQRLMMEIIDSLPPEQKMTVLFYYYDEMSVKEIAAAMEVSEGTVKSRLNYARKSIKEGVEKLEKKGTKLYGISPLPFLAYFLQKSMAAEGLSPAAAGAITQGTFASVGTAGTAAGTAAGATAAAGSAGSAGTAAAAAGAAAKGIVGSKLALGLAGLAVAGTVVGGVALSSRQAEPEPTPTPVSTAAVAVVTPTPEPEATPEPEPYAEAYARKVRELMEVHGLDGYLYGLVYIDEGPTPELIAGTAEQVNVYAVSGGELYTVREGWTTGRTGVPCYYPGKNAVVELYSTMAEGSHMEMTHIYFRVNSELETEEFFRSQGELWNDERDRYPETPEELEGLESERLMATMTAMEILDLLGEPLEPAAPPEPTPEPTPTPEVTPEPTPAVEEFVIEHGVLVKYNGPGGDVVIPDGVTVIGKGAFISSQSRKALTGVTLPIGVTGIGENAFQGCFHLKRISLPVELTSIGNGAFRGCLELNGISLPAGLISIGDDAFRQCEALRSITIPNQTTTIGQGAFASSGLESIKLPDSVTDLGGGVFSYCENLSQVSLGTGLTQIESTTFYACPSLTEITIPANISHMGSNVFFDGTYNLTTVTILNPEVSFESTFYKASTMNPALTLYAPAGSTTETYATQNRIPFVALDAPEPTPIPTPEPTPTADPDFTIENGTLVKYNGPGGDVIIPDGVVRIETDAFRYNTTVTSVTIPDGVIYIGGTTSGYGVGSGAFDGCTSLTQVTIPNSVTCIGHGAFQNCTSLTDISLPSALTELRPSAFRGCSSLTSITIPAGVPEIGWWTFDSCSSLTSATILNSEIRFRYGLDDGVTKGAPFNGCPVTIHGIEGSTAESYAKNHDFPFEPI